MAVRKGIMKMALKVAYTLEIHFPHEENGAPEKWVKMKWELRPTKWQQLSMALIFASTIQYIEEDPWYEYIWQRKIASQNFFSNQVHFKKFTHTIVLLTLISKLFKLDKLQDGSKVLTLLTQLQSCISSESSRALISSVLSVYPNNWRKAPHIKIKTNHFVFIVTLSLAGLFLTSLVR